MTRGTWRAMAMGAAVMLLGAWPALAGPGGPGRHGHRMRGPRGPLAGFVRAVHRLDLTEEQRTQIRNILEAARPKFEAERSALRELRQSARSGDPTAFDEATVRSLAREAAKHREEIAVLAAKTRAEIAKVLTEQQRQQLVTWHQQLEQRRGRMRECMEQMGPPPWAGGPGAAPEPY